MVAIAFSVSTDRLLQLLLRLVAILLLFLVKKGIVVFHDPFHKGCKIGFFPNRHSLSGCFSLQLEKNTDKATSALACFFLICKVSICEAKELNISVLKSSSKLRISALVAPPLADF